MANSLLLLFARQNYHDFCAFERKAAKLLLNIDKFKTFAIFWWVNLFEMSIFSFTIV
jgi:hypothetical protein